MNFKYRNGRCVILKKDMTNCLVLPKGTLSRTTDTFISKEGFEKLKEIVSKESIKDGRCCINRQYYEGCYIVPMGVLHPKVSMLLSDIALSGIGSAISNAPKIPSDKDPNLEAAKLSVKVAEEKLEKAKDILDDSNSAYGLKVQEKFADAQDVLDKAKSEEELITAKTT